MVTTVLIFALVSALFELILLLRFAPQALITRNWFQVTVHTLVIAANLAIHFGTVVGTMTAVTAGLVSFATMPIAVLIKTFWKNYKITVPSRQ